MAGSADTRIALLSIHPEFARGILSGAKRVEFRRRGFAKAVSHVIVYSTAPECRVVGYFAVAGVETATPDVLWHRHGHAGLISKDRFIRYFAGVQIGCAICVGDVVKLPSPWQLQAVNGHGMPPQSFAYVERAAADRLMGIEPTERFSVESSYRNTHW